jgi:hypothetical protein
MQARKPQLKLYLASKAQIDPDTVVPVFHRFIRERALGSELLVDVTSYGHVHEGPGIVLVGDGSDYYFDYSEGRTGLIYSRKRRAPEDALECLVDALRRTFAAALLLEQETSFSPRLEFRTDELLFRVNDRLLAPNTDAGFEALRPTLEAALGRLFAKFTLAREGSEKELLTARIAAPGAPPVAALLDRLGGPPR